MEYTLLSSEKSEIYMYMTLTHCEGEMDGFINSLQREILHSCE